MNTTEPIYDASNRLIAPPQTVLPVRPAGIWDMNSTAACAVYAFWQPDFGNGPGFPMFTIHGGPSDKSTVSAETLAELGIAIPHWKAA